MPKASQAFVIAILLDATAPRTQPSTAPQDVTWFATTRRNGTASSLVPRTARTTYGQLRCATRLTGARPGRSPLVLPMRTSPTRDLTTVGAVCRSRGSDEI